MGLLEVGKLGVQRGVLKRWLFLDRGRIGRGEFSYELVVGDSVFEIESLQVGVIRILEDSWFEIIVVIWSGCRTSFNAVRNKLREQEDGE